MQPSRTCSRGHEFTGEEPCPVCWPGYRRFELKAKLWLYDGDAAWHFITLPAQAAEQIKERFGGSGKSWGMVKVQVTVGSTSWLTSIFQDNKRGSYLLPVKAAVRKKEQLAAGQTISFVLEVQDG